MIIRWKQVSATLYVAKWQDRNFELRYEGHTWELWVNETRNKNRWGQLSQAQDYVEVEMQKIIRNLGEKVVAKQRPLSVVRNA